MSSMRNAVHRRNHQERAQPLERQKWGLLEKHKDYALRARDHGIKKTKLKAMRQKAADRNPDEFSFAMLSSRTGKNGAKILDRGNKALDHDVVKLLKTQDAGYLRTALAQVRKERERFENMFFIEQESEDGEENVATVKGGAHKKHHHVFVDSEGEQKHIKNETRFGMNNASSDQDHGQIGTAQQINEVLNDTQKENVKAALSQKPKWRLQQELEAEAEAERQEELARKRRSEGHDKLQKQYEILQEREQALTQAIDELDAQRSRMAGTVGGVNKKGVKFKVRQRKR